MKPKILDLTLCALFAVIIALCSWLSIPSAVPFTLQTFAVFLALLVLGGKRATVSVAIYILLGTVGLPVFHLFTGGLGILIGPTGGYIVGFLPLCICYLIITKAGEKLWIKALALLIGLVMCYICGTVQFAAVSQISIKSAFITTVVPFIIPDTIKLIFSLILSARLKKIIRV